MTTNLPELRSSLLEEEEHVSITRTEWRRLVKIKYCLARYVPVLIVEMVLVALELLGLLDEPLPLLFCVTACTIWPAELKTMSTRAFNGEYKYVFFVKPLPRA